MSSNRAYTKYQYGTYDVSVYVGSLPACFWLIRFDFLFRTELDNRIDNRKNILDTNRRAMFDISDYLFS